MSSIVATTKTQRDLNEIMNFLNANLQNTDASGSGNFWNNSDLTPTYNAVPTDTETHFQLSRAKENGVINRLHSHHRLAFTLRLKESTGGLLFDMTTTAGKVRCWNLGQIRFLSNKKDTTKVSNHNEVEFWVGGEQVNKSDTEKIIKAIKNNV